MEFRWLWNIGRILIGLGALLFVGNVFCGAVSFVPSSGFASNYVLYRDFALYGAVMVIIGGVLQVLVRIAQKISA
jgi:hypothetical protein